MTSTITSIATTSIATTSIATTSIATLMSVAIAPLVLSHPAPHSSPVLHMAQATTPLSGSWRLANMTAGDLPTPMLPAGETPLTVEFSGDRIGGSGGCNRFMGGFETNGETLDIGPLASTFKACEPGVMNQEAQYLKALQGAEQYEIDDEGNLTISYRTEQGGGVLRFVPQTVRALW